MALENRYPKYACQKEILPKSHNESYTMAPVAKVIFASKGKDFVITMGLKSCPDVNNTAALKSLEFGGSDGAAVEIIIIDEKGGEFDKFEQTIVRNVCKGEVQMKVQYGWAYTDSNGNVKSDLSGFIYCILIEYSVQFEPTGMIKYTLSGKDQMHVVFPAREDEVFGDDKNKMHLEDAIVQLGNKNDPKIKFEFKRHVPNSVPKDWHFKDWPDKPKSVWHSNGTNKLSIVKEWSKDYLTDQDKGFVPIYDWTKTEPTCTLWEDTKTCNGATACESKRTYIVNGGRDSNVISFTPTMKYSAAFLSKGTGGGVGSTGGDKALDKKDPEAKAKNECPWFTDKSDKKIGATTSVSHSPHVKNSEGQDGNIAIQMRAQDKKLEAEQGVNSFLIGPITADLKIKGDTSDIFMNPMVIHNTKLSIVVINPQYLDSAAMTCDSWLAEPPVNQVLSNKEWLITEAQHSINESTFTTTLKLLLMYEPNKQYGENGYQPSSQGCKE